MATTLYFVQSDTLPQIKLTLTDETTQLPKVLTGLLVSLHAKPVVGSGVSFTRPAIISNQTTDPGVAIIAWEDGDLNRPAGDYNAEIEVYDPVTRGRETIYDLIKLVIREDIADIPNTSTPYLPLPAPTSPAPNAP